MTTKTGAPSQQSQVGGPVLFLLYGQDRRRQRLHVATSPPCHYPQTPPSLQTRAGGVLVLGFFSCLFLTTTGSRRAGKTFYIYIANNFFTYSPTTLSTARCWPPAREGDERDGERRRGTNGTRFAVIFVLYFKFNVYF
jgi:hypothetical protein